ncbi:MAG: type II secretion system protein [Candidatus Pacebacteria bacterium]|nr:type II secretion system protein [Candidatus Paceibacterota bacterium]
MIQNKNCQKKGFTLIELLVVVSIIGILSVIVLASLATSRAKSADAGIQSELVHARNQIELYYAAYGNYGANYTLGGTSPTLCVASSGTIFADAKIKSILDNAGKLSGGNDLNKGGCMVLGNAWAVAMPLKTDSTYAWCVDSTSASRKIYTTGGSGSPSTVINSSAACK